MTVTNFGRNRTTLLLGGSITENLEYFKIGSGSGTAAITDTDLIHSVDRQAFTATTYPSSRKVKLQGDWNTVEMSGIQLREFGLTHSGTALTGSVWSRTSLPGLTFDGTNELRCETTIELF